jgi:hypothetical protein
MAFEWNCSACDEEVGQREQKPLSHLPQRMKLSETSVFPEL